MANEARQRVAVVGGGITGLAAARRLSRLAPRADVTLFERDTRLGGKIVTERVDGFTIEGGPDSFLSVKPRGVGLCQEIGLGAALQGTIEANRRTFVMKRGALYPLPEGLTGLVPTELGPILQSDLLSWFAKARFALDFVLPPRRSEGDETLAAFVQRRLGGEVYARLIEPLMAGIYAGDGRKLSLAATFPQLREAERRHGSLIRGVLATRSASSAGTGTGTGGPTPKPGFLTPRDGTGALVTALEHHLRAAGVHIRTDCEATGLIPAGGGYRLVIGPDHQVTETPLSRAPGEGGGVPEFSEGLPPDDTTFDAIILATPAWATAKLLRDVDAEASRALAAIPHVSSATISLGYRQEDLSRPPDGYGYVVPRSEGRPVLACTWTSNKWAQRAPDGHVLLRAFAGRAGQPDPLDQSDAELIDLARNEFRDILGLTADPVVSRVYRWPEGMPQYNLGHLDRVGIAEARLAAHPALAVAGNGYHGVGIPDCIRSGETAAERIMADLAVPFAPRRYEGPVTRADGSVNAP